MQDGYTFSQFFVLICRHSWLEFVPGRVECTSIHHPRQGTFINCSVNLTLLYRSFPVPLPQSSALALCNAQKIMILKYHERMMGKSRDSCIKCMHHEWIRKKISTFKENISQCFLQFLYYIDIRLDYFEYLFLLTKCITQNVIVTLKIINFIL